MSYEFYKIIHLLGLSMVVMSLGGIMLFAINGGQKASAEESFFLKIILN